MELLKLRAMSAIVRLVCAAAPALWMLGGPGALYAQVATAEPTEDELQSFAAHRVVQVEVDIDENTRKVGTAVVLKTMSKAGSSREYVAVFVTAYHVLQGAKSFQLLGDTNRVIAKSKNSTKCYPDRLRELAFVEVEASIDNPDALKPIALEPRVPAPLPQFATRPYGKAFGFAGQGGALAIDVRFQNRITAKQLRGLVDLASAPLPDEGTLSPTNTVFQILTKDASIEGMSGGLVIDHLERFGGLIYGRRTDLYNIIIPADAVIDAWKQASSTMGDQKWKRLEHNPFAHGSFFGGSENDAEAKLDRVLAEFAQFQKERDNDRETISLISILLLKQAKEQPFVKNEPIIKELQRRQDQYLEGRRREELPQALQDYLELPDAQIAFEQGDFTKAIALANPQKAELFLRDDQKVQEAVSRYRVIARCHLNLKEPAKAAAVLKKIVSTPFAEDLDTTMLAFAQYQAGDRDGSLRVCDMLLGTSHRPPPGMPSEQALLFGGIFFLRAHMLDEAKEYARAAADYDDAAVAFDYYLDKTGLGSKYAFAVTLFVSYAAANFYSFRGDCFDSLEKYEEAGTAFGECARRLRQVLQWTAGLKWLRQLMVADQPPSDKKESRDLAIETLDLAGAGDNPPGDIKVAFVRSISAQVVQSRLADVLESRANEIELQNLTQLKAKQVTDWAAWRTRYASLIHDRREAVRLYEGLEKSRKTPEGYELLANSLRNASTDLYQNGDFKEAGDYLFDEMSARMTLIQRYHGKHAGFRTAAVRLAWVLATCPEAAVRDGKSAVALASGIAEVEKWSDYWTIKALAAAEADSGEFESAAKHQEQAISLAPNEEKQEMQSILALYQKRQPYREDPRKMAK